MTPNEPNEPVEAEPGDGGRDHETEPAPDAGVEDDDDDEAD